MIQTPEDFADRLEQAHHGKDVVESANAAKMYPLITERDAAIRLEAREEHRLEVVARIEELQKLKLGDRESSFNDGYQQALSFLLRSDVFQPTKPKVHPRAVSIARSWQVTSPGLSSPDYTNELAALISSEVKEWK